MKSLSKHPVLVFAFAGMIALAATGCSYSSESSSSFETSVTDENGNTKTTTTTTTTKDGKTETETTQSSDSDLSYLNEYFHVGYRTPAGMTKDTMDPANDYEEVDYFVKDADDNAVVFFLANRVTGLDGVTDAASWKKVYADAAEKSMKDAGETDIKRTEGDTTIGTTPVTYVHFESEADGETLYRDHFFMTDADGDGLRIALTANSEEGLEVLRDGLAGPEK